MSPGGKTSKQQHSRSTSSSSMNFVPGSSSGAAAPALPQQSAPIPKRNTSIYLLNLADSVLTEMSETHTVLEEIIPRHGGDHFMPATLETKLLGDECGVFSPIEATNAKRPSTVDLAAQKAEQPLEVQHVDAPDLSCSLYFIPLNRLGSFCCDAVGPRLDLLRRKGDYFETYGSMVEGKERRGWKWWLCLAEGKLYFYQCRGEMNPRFISDVSNAEIRFSNTNKGGTDSIWVTLLHQDGRVWRLGFNSMLEAKKFAFAIRESHLVVKGEKSKYLLSGFGNHGFAGIRTLGHTCTHDYDCPYSYALGEHQTGAPPPSASSNPELDGDLGHPIRRLNSACSEVASLTPSNEKALW